MAYNPSIAILYFSRTSARDAAKKFSSKPINGKAILSAVDLQTRHHLQESGLPVFHFHEKKQQGKTFGERLNHAFESLYKEGFSSVIAIGNDCPDLTSVKWETVKKELNSGKSVLGPDMRGGVYLLGLTREDHLRMACTNLPWQTSSLFLALKTSLEAYGSAVCMLHRLADFNRIEDVYAWARLADNTSFLKQSIIHLLSKSSSDHIPRSTPCKLAPFEPHCGLRAPPQAA